MSPGSPGDPAGPAGPAACGDEALVQFLYQVPIGLLQLREDGAIDLINPTAAQLLLPLVPPGLLLNLFDALAGCAPQLPALVAAQTQPGAVVCDGLRLHLPPQLGTGVGSAPAEPGATVLSLHLSRMDAQRLVAVLSDVSAVVAAEQRRLAAGLRAQARADLLTGLPGRQALHEEIGARLAAAHAAGRPGPVLLLFNIDRFQLVNLDLGPAAGDALLQQVSQRLQQTLHQAGPGESAAPAASTWLARPGGDEFAVLADGLASAAAAEPLARRLLQALRQPYLLGGPPLHLSLRAGVAQAGPACDSADALLQQAALALQDARRDGPHRLALFDPAMQLRASLRAETERALHEALAGQQLFVVYQPIVALADGSLAGVEALVRWRHPQRGLVPPSDFIPVAEQTGQIAALGAFVLESACAQFMQWRQQLGAAAPRSVSVNLSRAQLADAALPGQVAAALQRHGMPGAALQLEVTESLAAQDDAVRAQLQRLKALGLRLALDDFGTGYSSLSSLHQLPVDVVKIDRSFVSQLETSPHHRVLVEATVRVATSLGMATVAEGVETPGQARQLAALHCRKAQGYWFGRPMAAEALAGWVQARLDARGTVQAAAG